MPVKITSWHYKDHKFNKYYTGEHPREIYVYMNKIGVSDCATITVSCLETGEEDIIYNAKEWFEEYNEENNK